MFLSKKNIFNPYNAIIKKQVFATFDAGKCKKKIFLRNVEDNIFLLILYQTHHSFISFQKLADEFKK